MQGGPPVSFENSPVAARKSWSSDWSVSSSVEGQIVKSNSYLMLQSIPILMFASGRVRLLHSVVGFGLEVTLFFGSKFPVRIAPPLIVALEVSPLYKLPIILN